MENKLLVFLQEEVLNWPLRGKRKRENDDPDARLGASSVETYVSAVVSIYDGQVTRGLNRNPHPRGPAMKAMLEAHCRREHQRRRDAYEDRGKGTIHVGYRLDDMRRLASTLWNETGEACEQNLRRVLVGFVQPSEPCIANGLNFLNRISSSVTSCSPAARCKRARRPLYDLSGKRGGRSPACFPLDWLMWW